MRVSADGWYRQRVAVRFRDLDAMGHAHHTLPLIYLEEARAAFWRELTGNDSLEAIDYVIAEIRVRYHARVLYPAEVEVATSVEHVGEKSFTMRFELRDATGASSGQLLASGGTVQVAYDYASHRSQPIDAGVRSALIAWRDAFAQNRSATVAEMMPITPPSQ